MNDTLRLLDLSANSVSAEVAKHFLYSGTKIIRARRPQETPNDEAVALAVVVRTGFNTTKGALIRSMLFPKPSGFKFYKDAFRYISVMAGVAGIGFIASFINFLRLGVSLQPSFMLLSLLVVVGMASNHCASVGLDHYCSTSSITCNAEHWDQFCTISPQEKRYILYQSSTVVSVCLSANLANLLRVNVGGKLDIVCFDKTGTLTEEGLDVLGLRVVNRPVMRCEIFRYVRY